MEEFILSDLAKELLSEAVKSPEGVIQTREYNGGFTIATNGKNYGDGSPRVNANNRQAIEQLERDDLIKAEASDYYKVTSEGFEYGESLSEPA